MRIVNLGRSGLQVSCLGLGTVPFGTRLGDAECRRMVDLFLDAGGNLVDTANVYGRSGLDPSGVGASERAVGRAISHRRNDVVLATKGYWLLERQPRPNRVGLSRAYLTREIEASLARLGADHIDLYQCHIWDPYTPLEETLRVLDDAIRAGKIRYYGVSNWDGWHVVKGAAVARAGGHQPLLSNQIWYTLADRGAETSIIEACRDQEVGVIAWGALAQGFLSGRYRRGSRVPDRGSRFSTTADDEPSSWKSLATERNWALIEVLDELAAKHNRTVAEIALAGLLALGGCDVALLGAPDPERLAEQVTSGDLELAQTDIGRLRAVSAPAPSYPTSMYDQFIYRDSPAYGGARPAAD